MTSADEKLPQWMRVRTNDWDTPAGRYLLAGGGTQNWADYGRWFALRQMLATTPDAYIDASDDRRMGALTRQLGFSSRAACRRWVESLAACDAISAADWEGRGWVTDPDVSEQQRAYAARVITNRANRRGGRKGGDASDDGATSR